MLSRPRRHRNLHRPPLTITPVSMTSIYPRCPRAVILIVVFHVVRRPGAVTVGTL